MGKLFCSLAVIIFSFACVSCSDCQHRGSTSTSHEIEQLVLGTLDWESPGIVECIESEQGFTKDGESNFYIPNDELSAFGFKVAYVGLLGVNYVPGPNIIVEGGFQSVADAIEEQSELSFERSSEGCSSRIHENLELFVCPHPDKPNLTIILCGYFGP